MFERSAKYKARAIEAMNAGFTTKADQKRVNEDLSRAYSSLIDYKVDVPYSLAHVRANHIAEVAKELGEEAKSFLLELIALREKAITTPIVKKQTVKERKAAEIAKIDETGKTQNIIRDLIEPMKADAIARARQEAEKFVSTVEEKLREFNFDANAFAPYVPLNHRDYTKNRERREVVSMFCVTDPTKPNTHRSQDPRYVVMSEDKIAHYIKMSEAEAAANYDAFVLKMIAKIGAIDSATITGNHIWGYSVLTVKKGDVIENWKTQMIVNVSKLGKLFNQWPTRLMK